MVVVRLWSFYGVGELVSRLFLGEVRLARESNAAANIKLHEVGRGKTLGIHGRFTGTIFSCSAYYLQLLIIEAPLDLNCGKR
jgi:hypothetical protein